MAVSSGLLLKGTGALAATTAVSGGTYWLITNSNEVKRNEITRYDKGLIDYLENGGKIQFKVTHGANSGTDLTNFPSFTTEATSLTVSVKVSVNTGDGAASIGILTDNDKAKKEDLKKINGKGNGTDWTWSCEVKFIRKQEDKNVTELSDKDLLAKSDASNKGFFNKLTETDEKDLKIKFIRNCAWARGTEKNKKVNKANDLSTTVDKAIKPANTLIAEKNFHLRKGIADKKERNGSTNESESKLYFESESKFSAWFLVQK